MTAKLPPEVEEAITGAVQVGAGYDTCCERWYTGGNPDPAEYGDTHNEHERALKDSITAACEKAYAAGQASRKEAVAALTEVTTASIETIHAANHRPAGAESWMECDAKTCSLAFQLLFGLALAEAAHP